MIPLNSLQLDKDMPAENAGIFFLKILHIVYVAQKINKRGDKYEKDCISDINNPDDYLYGTGNHP